MQAARRKSSAETQRRPLPADFVAAVRYPDGSRDLFHVLNADDFDDARAMVLSEVGDVLSLVIAQKH